MLTVQLKTIKDIKEYAYAHDWEISTEEYDKKESSLIHLQHSLLLYKVVLDMESGRFTVYNAQDEEIATQNNTEYDKKDWYAEILAMIYG